MCATQANDFYVKTETRLRGQLDILEEEIKHEKTDVERFKSAKKQIVKHFAPELSELRSFVILNYTAVVKAVKKYNKNCNKERTLWRLSATCDVRGYVVGGGGDEDRAVSCEGGTCGGETD